MSLDYRLADGMTNGDLPNDGNDHFSFCLTMMVVGVRTLQENNYDTYRQRVVEFMLADGKRTETIEWTLDYAEAVKGMTTNVSPITDAKWRRKIYDVISERAGFLVSTHETCSDFS